MTAKKYKRPARRVSKARDVSEQAKAPTCDEIRAIVREEVKLALGVILDAMRRTQPGQGGLHQAWIDAVLDENTSIHCAFFGRRKSVTDTAATASDLWLPISQLPCGARALLRRKELRAVGGYGPHGGFITAEDGCPLPWQPTEFQPVAAS